MFDRLYAHRHDPDACPTCYGSGAGPTVRAMGEAYAQVHPAADCNETWRWVSALLRRLGLDPDDHTCPGCEKGTVRPAAPGVAA